MDLTNVNTQQLQLLARKGQLYEELKQIDAVLGQLTAITQFAQAQPKPSPERDSSEGPTPAE